MYFDLLILLQDHTDIAIPVQTANRGSSYMGLRYSNMMDLYVVNYLGYTPHTEPENEMTSLFKSLFQTWPLLVMTLSLGIGAGSVIWVLVNFILLINISSYHHHLLNQVSSC